MMRAVQATLLHHNSTDEHPRHHLCPEGETSWCKFNKVKAKGEVFKHTKKPIPEAIVPLLKPIYARLGSRSLMEKCVDGYTQNANEALHHVLWGFCPKELFMGKVGVDIAAALAVSCFNDGASSLARLPQLLDLMPTPVCVQFLSKKDKKRLRESKYKMSENAKKRHRACRRKRKGLEDKNKAKEGEICSWWF